LKMPLRPDLRQRTRWGRPMRSPTADIVHSPDIESGAGRSLVDTRTDCRVLKKSPCGTFVRWSARVIARKRTRPRSASQTGSSSAGRFIRKRVLSAIPPMSNKME
ncbi:hypothetical protein L917_01679, partial [Phytophthora nicotianae]